MNFTKEAMERRILNDVKKVDKDLMQAIQDNMFTFENLGMSDDRSLQTLLRSVESEDLILALKSNQWLTPIFCRCLVQAQLESLCLA